MTPEAPKQSLDAPSEAAHRDARDELLALAEGDDEIAAIAAALHRAMPGVYDQDCYHGLTVSTCGIDAGMLYDAGLRVAPSASGDSLDVAWREAEAALPEGWWLQVDHGPQRDDCRAQAGEPVWSTTYTSVVVAGPTPAAALRALAARLRSEPTGATPESEG